VSFFAYPGKKSYLVPDACKVHQLVTPAQDALASLQKLVIAVDAEHTKPKLQEPEQPLLPQGKLTAAKVCQAIGALLPANAIVSDEAQTSGAKLPAFTANAPRHDLLTLTGGAIGQGLPVALGAAVAGNGRPVVALIGDGAAMYTIQALWTIVREALDVTVIIFNNRSYSILNIELERVGAEKAGPKARAQLDLSAPGIEFVELARSMGMPARKTSTAEEFNAALKIAFNESGPHLIDAIVPSEFEGFRLRALPHVLGAIERLPGPMGRALKRKVAP